MHYNIQLRIKHIREGEEKDYIDLIDLAYIYNEEEEDPILQWLQENRESILDEEQSRPCSRITSEMDIDVEEYMSSSGRFRGNTPGLRGDSGTDDDDGTQLPDDDDGGIGDATLPAIEEPQGYRET